jgi:hypothetical protein
MTGFMNTTTLCEASHFQEICTSIFSSVFVKDYWMRDNTLVSTFHYILETDSHIILYTHRLGERKQNDY